MRRRQFLKITSAIPAAALVPSIVIAGQADQGEQHDFLAFVRHISPDFALTDHHKKVIRAMESGKRLIINTPPMFGKTTLNTMYAAYSIGKEPKTRVAYLSYSGDVAAMGVRSAMDALTSPKCHEFFGRDTTPHQKGRGGWPRLVENSNGGHVRGYGLHSATMGAQYDLILADDPQNRRIIQDQDAEWFENVFLQRLALDGRAILSQTRIHQFDLSGQLDWPRIEVKYSDVAAFYAMSRWQPNFSAIGPQMWV